MSNSRELPTHRIATADESGRRIYLYPADVRGKYRQRRVWTRALLIWLFLLLPWFKINGHPAILLDLPNRRFAILGLLFWAHDAPILLLVAGVALFGLAFATAVWGRIWCGWACPQTVFVDGVFRRIERWIEGDSVERKRLDEAPMTFFKVSKKTLKWGLFLIVSLVITHSFLAYFVGPEELAKMISRSPTENPGSFLVILAMTALILFDFGWFREQFCTIACPYGRFQSVLMDGRSQVVAYDSSRGEPRRGTAPLQPGTSVGDCVNCYRCVQVCPTGIDIRRGLQMECIACTACMDACDDVMARLAKPRGLIRYKTLEAQKGSKAFRTRPAAYAAIILLCMTGLFVIVHDRKPLEADLTRAAEAPYQVITDADGSQKVINHFKIDLKNQSFDPERVNLAAAPESVSQGVQLVVSNFQARIGAGQSERSDIFVEFPKSALKFGHAKLNLLVNSGNPNSEIDLEAHLVGPFN